MDTSELYVKMCREAKEIQEKWRKEEKSESGSWSNINIGDFFVLGNAFLGDGTPQNLCVISDKTLVICANSPWYWRYEIGGGRGGHYYVQDTNPARETTRHSLMQSKYGDSFYSTWIPRQDQLQIMLDKYDKPKYENDKPKFFLERFYEWITETSAAYESWYELPEETRNINAESMEQLWLAFVMLELYNKLWSGQTWEEIK